MIELMIVKLSMISVFFGGGLFEAIKKAIIKFFLALFGF